MNHDHAWWYHCRTADTKLGHTCIDDEPVDCQECLQVLATRVELALQCRHPNWSAVVQSGVMVTSCIDCGAVLRAERA